MDDVDIYADLPNFNLDPEKNDPACNCEELKKELASLVNKFENVERSKENLKTNLSSLLKTARAEIARKDRIIDDLRKRLDDTVFRRNNRSESTGLSAHRPHIAHRHHITSKKYDSIPSVNSPESETESSHYDERTSKKSQIDVVRIPPTVFGERLRKRIMEDEKARKHKAPLSKLSAEETPEENIVESDKENGSQPAVINNNGNESNIIAQHLNSETPCKKTLGRRGNENEDKVDSKNLRIEDDVDAAAGGGTDLDLKDTLARFEDRLDGARSLKNEEEISGARHRAASEYRDAKHSRDYKNGWRTEEKGKPARDRDGSRNSRIASTSSRCVLDGHNGDHKRSDYRYNPLKRSYSKSRSDYGSSPSSRYIRKRSDRTYRGGKYEDYEEYSGRRRGGGLRRSYEREESDRKAKYRNRERGDSRERFRYSSSDVDDRESSGSHKRRESSRRLRETASSDKRPRERNDKVATEIDDLRIVISSRTIVNTVADPSTGKHSRRSDETNLTESALTRVATSDSNNLEEGEIIDSPEKEGSKSARISRGNKTEENSGKIVKGGDDVAVVASTMRDRSIPSRDTKRLEEATDIGTKSEAEPTSFPSRTDSKDEVTGKDNAICEMDNCASRDTRESHVNDDLMPTAIGTVEQVCDSDIGNADEKSEGSITFTRITDADADDTTKPKKTDDINIGDAAKIVKVNNIDNNDSGREIRSDGSKSTTVKVAVKVEAVLNCDKEKSQIASEICRTLSKSAVETTSRSYLSDHNYVQSTPLVGVITDVVPTPFASSSECCDAKEPKAREISCANTKSRKDQRTKEMVISRRRKAVTLSDSSASMTILMNTKVGKVCSDNNNFKENDSTLKPRACKVSRTSAKACK